MQKSESIKNIAIALCKFQAEVKNPGNNAQNPMYKSKYSTLDEVINTVKPVLAKFGLSFLQSTGTSEDGEHMSITTLLMHESGEWLESDPLVLPAYKLGKGGVKQYDAQAAGIAITYGRRYSLSALLGVSSQDDDDANGIVHDSDVQQGKPVSPKQVALLKVRAGEFAKMREVESAAVFEKLGIDDLQKINSTQASQAIQTLENWIEKAKGA